MDTRIWADLFHMGAPLAEKILRPIVIYLFLVVALRLAGKRELAQLNPFDLVVLLTLSNTVQNAIIGNDNSMLGGVIGASTLLAINFLVVRFLYDHAALDRIVEGSPETLMEKGHIFTEHLRKNLITKSELESAAHRQGFSSLGEIERAVLEAGGGITFTAKKPTAETVRHAEVVARLEGLSRALERLQRGAEPAP